MTTIEGFIVLVAISVFFTGMILLGRNELVRRRLTCPRDGDEAEVDVVQRYKATHPVRVQACDHLPDPKKVDCDQGCLGQCS